MGSIDTIPKHEDDPQPHLPFKSSVLHRSFNHHPTTVVSADNLTLTLDNGAKILDACGGAAVSCLGYHQPYIKEITDAVTRQLSTVPYAHTLTYTTNVAEELATTLIENYGAKHGIEKCYFLGSGSEAMDVALKLARQYWFEVEGPDTKRCHYISRKQSYHGNTVGAMSVSSFLARKVPYVGDGVLQLGNVSWVSPAYSYRYSKWEEGETEEELAERLVRELEEEILRVGKDKVIAFVAETVVGAATGCVVSPKGYFRGVREVCDKYGVLLILDEVMSGMGRCGTMFAFEGEGEGVRPDLMTMGKGLGGGFAPIAAVLMHKRVADGLRSGSGNVAHGQTYQAHPVSCSAALAVQRIIMREGLVERCRKMGLILERLLKEELGDLKYVGNIRGRGLFWGIEFVKDKQTREPFEPKLSVGPGFQERVFKKGVAIYPGSGTADGIKGDNVIVCPAYTVTEDDLRVILTIIKEAYAEMEHDLDSR
jgi:adenosylmethionine-8-amino-7-oxononanoate aminotransferase